MKTQITKELHDSHNELMLQLSKDDDFEGDLDFAWFEINEKGLAKIRTQINPKAKDWKIAHKITGQITSGCGDSLFEEYKLDWETDVSYFIGN